MDVANVSSAVYQHLAAAINRWENVIVGDLSRGELPRGFFQSGANNSCSFAEVTNGTAVDDAIVLVNIGTIGGRGGILGQATPCAIRDDILTIVGILTLDADDLQPLVGTQTLTDIIFHEIGHILCFGTLWDGFDCPPDAGFTRCWNYVTGSGTADPASPDPRRSRNGTRSEGPAMCPSMAREARGPPRPTGGSPSSGPRL